MLQNPLGMTSHITVISSMATRQLLADLAVAWQQHSGQTVAVESVGGVDAARRVQAGEVFDLVVLAADAIDKLMQSGHLQAGSRVDLVRSPVALAVRAGAPGPDISTEASLRQAVLAARNIGYSTGPSGAHLARLFDRWGLAEQFKTLAVQAPPGVPVARLVADGTVELGFQQLSELQHQPGVDVLGVLPAGCDFITTFSAAGCPASAQPAAAAAWLRFITAPERSALVCSQGMQPA